MAGAVGQSQKLSWAFVETLLYKADMNRAIKQNLANRQCATEVLETPMAKAALDEIAALAKPVPTLDSLPAGSGNHGSTKDACNSEPLIDPRLVEASTHVPAGMSDETKEKLQRSQALAHRIVSQSVALLVEPSDEAKVMTTIAEHCKNDSPCVVEGDNHSYVVCLYDTKLSGESVTHPHLRVQSFREVHYQKMLRGVMRGLLSLQGADTVLDKTNFPQSLMVMMYDAGKHQMNDSALTEVFKVGAGASKMLYTKNTLHLHYSEAGLEDRRSRMKLTAPLSLHAFEWAHIFTKDVIKVEYKKRTKFEGSSVSDGLGPVRLTPEDGPNTWVKTFREKKLIYGKENRIAPGGRTPGVDSETAKTLTRKDDELEPVFFFALPSDVHHDNFSCLNAHRVIDCTPGDGAAARACMELGIPYLGFCMTACHAKALKSKLTSEIFPAFSTEGDPFYRPGVAVEL